MNKKMLIITGRHKTTEKKEVFVFKSVEQCAMYNTHYTDFVVKGFYDSDKYLSEEKKIFKESGR